MHHAKAIRRNEMPFGRDTHVVPSNIVLDSGPGLPTRRVDLVLLVIAWVCCLLSIGPALHSSNVV